jgi:hypothetical protein
MRQVIVVLAFAVIFLGFSGCYIAFTMLNFRKWKRARTRPIVSPDIGGSPAEATGFPWSPNYRGQPWPDPNTEPSEMTHGAALYLAGAAERRAKRYLLLGDAAIFILAIPAGLFAPMFLQRWPDPPGNMQALFIGFILGLMLGGISLKVYASPYWQEISLAYTEVAERIAAVSVPEPPTVPRSVPRTARARFAAAWRAFRA